ncbi:MATE family efflux transporter [Treponema ruminis]|uniref:Putative MATE family efflux protein n=1 Tax=Treponema ruminis TaxID=744515 RepID=A0A7W8G704_9SPIR|nr:MATE family efflux transporter [Treponema ruminis]MBB5225038.1 putative MATE family efflux protein [Treponema ruminis]
MFIEKSLEQRAESRQFFKSLFTIVGPIALQNLISAAVGSADVVMLGYVGQDAIAAVNLASYIQFILFLFFIGLSSGVVMLAAQYWGKKDTYSIETIFGIGTKISAAIGFVFAAGALFVPELLMKIFTNEEKLIVIGSEYLRVVGVSFVILAFSQIYQAVLKSIERVKQVTAITTAALLLNIGLNAVFIFGLFGAPKMGVKGVALATTISRVIELMLCVVICARVREIHFSVGTLFRKNTILLKDFIKYSVPAIGNEAVWGAGWSMYAVIMGHLGSDLVAANSVVSVVRNLASVLCFGMAYGGAILLGKQIGANQMELAGRNASRLVKSTILAGFVGAVLLGLCRPILFRIADLNEQASYFLTPLLYINCVSLFGAAINTVLICGVFRAGGDAKWGLILDSLAMWTVSVPIGFVCAFAFHLPPLVVYLILYVDEWEKMIFNVIHYKSKKWMKNITREF